MTELSKEEQWHNHIEACTNSGMNIRAWCKTNDLSVQQYHYWKKKFRSTEGNPKKDLPEWAPLITGTRQEAHSENTPIVLHIGEYKLELTRGFDPPALTALMTLLGYLC